MTFETSTVRKNGFPYFGKGSNPLPMFVRRQDTLTGNHVVSFTFADRVLFKKRKMLKDTMRKTCSQIIRWQSFMPSVHGLCIPE